MPAASLCIQENCARLFVPWCTVGDKKECKAEVTKDLRKQYDNN